MITRNKTPFELSFVVTFLLAATMSIHAQRVRGELRVEVRDPQGAAVAAGGELVSDVNQFRRTFQVTADGSYIARELRFWHLQT
jgi:hypothetical protein